VKSNACCAIRILQMPLYYTARGAARETEAEIGAAKTIIKEL